MAGKKKRLGSISVASKARVKPASNVAGNSSDNSSIPNYLNWPSRKSFSSSPPQDHVGILNPNIIREREEVGFLFLQEETVIFHIHDNGNRDLSLSSSPQKLPPCCSVSGKWIDVNLREDNNDNDNESEILEDTDCEASCSKEWKKINGEEKPSTTSTKPSVPSSNNEKNNPPSQDQTDMNIVSGNSRTNSITYSRSPCPRGDLIIDVNTDQDILEWHEQNMSTFSGSIDDMKYSSSSYSCTDKTEEVNGNHMKQRSDAALIMGTLTSCINLDYIRLESFQILITKWLDPIETTGNFSSLNEDISHHGDKGGFYHKVKVSIVVTISLPFLENTSRNIYQDNSNDGVDKLTQSLHKSDRRRLSTGSSTVTTDSSLSTRKRSRHSIETSTPSTVVKLSAASVLNSTGRKMLPCAQLLFSLLRSDWQHLKMDMKQLSRLHRSSETAETKVSAIPSSIVSTSKRKQHKRSLFPVEISLEELYARIESAAKHVKGASADLTKEKKKTRETSFLYQLPDEILQEHVATYLRAKSLQSLRSSCHHMHHVLRALVPGMKLRLFRHQVKSLYWMRQREEKACTEALAMEYFAKQIMKGDKKHASEDSAFNGDLYRAVTSGSIISIAPRRNHLRSNQIKRLSDDNKTHATESTASVPSHHHESESSDIPIWHVNVITGSVSQINQDQSAKIVAETGQVARGGLLCDDPGLGKTITVLSIILQTFGLSTEAIVDSQGDLSRGTSTSTSQDESQDDNNSQTIEKDEKRQEEDYYNDIITEFWREGLPSFSRHSEVIGVLKEVRGYDTYGLFESPRAVTKSEEATVIDDSICVMDIIAKSDQDEYCNDFREFFEDAIETYKNAMETYPPYSDEYDLAKRLLTIFTTFSIPTFKKKLFSSARRRSKSRTTIDSDNSIGALLQEKVKKDVLDSIIPSKATLLVVPHVLLQHWEEQIKMHIDFKFCTSKKPLLYRHSRKKTLMTTSAGIYETGDVDQVEKLCITEGTFCPMIFIDEGGTIPLPSARFLAIFHIVITTAKRLTNEWKNGSIQEELKNKEHIANNKMRQSYKRFNYEIVTAKGNESGACPLLKVHWLRLVVDEGHSMGKGTHNNSIQFASWITSQRRWAMTGTPTPQTVSNNGVKNLFGLLKFLKHDYFCSRRGGDMRYKHLTRAFTDGQLSVFFQLISLLNLFMVRHTKHDIEELPKPHFSKTYTQMSHAEKMAYNTLVSAVQMNIVTTSMIAKTSGRQDSLLHVSQYKHAQLALNNLRLACCGGTRVCPTILAEAKDEALNMLAVNDPFKRKLSSDYIDRVNSEQLSGCMRCGFQVQTLFLLPCACIICTECMTSETKICPSCNAPFDADQFQKLQPGIEYNWKWNLEEAKSSKKLADAQILEVLRQMAQRGLQNNIPIIHNSSNEEERVNPFDMVNNEELILASQLSKSSRRKGKHTCIFPRPFINGNCIICNDECNECFLLNDDKKCSRCHRVAEDPPEEESKSYYMTTKLLQLWTSTKLAVERQWLNSHSPSSISFIPDTHSNVRPLKVIVFSQFQQILNVVGDRLIRRFGFHCVAEYWGSTRNQELDRFINVTNCFVLLLGKSGSHGLDLSFVTHIFFLDEIMDKSLESQVVSRAYRMGATGPVKVEQLVALNSVEELMVDLNRRNEGNATNKIYLRSDEASHTIPSNGPTATSISKQRGSNAKEKADQQAKVHYLLSKVSLMRENAISICNQSAMKKNSKRGILRFVAKNESQREEDQDQKGTKRKQQSDSISDAKKMKKISFNIDDHI